MTGYMHPLYAAALSEFGKPRELPRCGGWILEREITGFPYKDAIGCYPRFFCNNWSLLREDIDDIGDELVSLSLVTPPFGEYDFSLLQNCFKDVVIPFKKHQILDLSLPLNKSVSKNRRKKARRALKTVFIELVTEPVLFIDDWVALYDRLIEKHKITGIHAFSHKSLGRQLSVPGILMFRAVHHKITIGATLWFVQNNVGYGHLAAFNDVGYDLNASYALDWYALDYFAKKKIRWLDFGAGAGIINNEEDGLNQYKRGWSSGERTVYFCGRILNHKQYSEISQKKNIAPTDYFPAYRKGEFS